MKILLAKLNHLGDTLLLTPTIRFLRERYPDARIDVLVRSGCEAMLANNSDINAVVVVARPEKRRRSLVVGIREFVAAFSRLFMVRYDYAFDLSESDRAKLWLLLSGARYRCVNDAYGTLDNKRWMVNRISRFRWAPEHQVLKDFKTVTECLGIRGEPGKLRFSASATLEELAAKIHHPLVAGAYVVSHPTSRWSFKHWVAERWAKVADWIVDHYGLSVIVSRGPGEYERDHVSEIRAA